jgi:rhodanese-related sulfurtransferase
MPFQTISPKAAHDAIGNGGGACVLLDVREPFEVAMASVPGALLIPMQQVPKRLAEIDRTKRVLVLCHHGMRSQQVADYLVRSGYANVASVNGGIEEWSMTVDASIPHY